MFKRSFVSMYKMQRVRSESRFSPLNLSTPSPPSVSISSSTQRSRVWSWSLLPVGRGVQRSGQGLNDAPVEEGMEKAGAAQFSSCRFNIISICPLYSVSTVNYFCSNLSQHATDRERISLAGVKQRAKFLSNVKIISQKAVHHVLTG